MVEETGNWTPQELAAVLRKWEHVGPRLCGRAADMIEAQAAFLNEHAPSLASKDEEIARLKAELAEESGWVSRHLLADAKTRAAIGEEFCLVPPDGGDVKTWKAAAALRARADSASAKTERLREALEKIADDAACVVRQYAKNGPTWTGKDGHEYADMSEYLDFATASEEQARAALEEGNDG